MDEEYRFKLIPGDGGILTLSGLWSPNIQIWDLSGYLDQKTPHYNISIIFDDINNYYQNAKIRIDLKSTPKTRTFLELIDKNYNPGNELDVDFYIKPPIESGEDMEFISLEFSYFDQWGFTEQDTITLWITCRRLELRRTKNGI